jgi:methionyl-tRNA synthetase
MTASKLGDAVPTGGQYGEAENQLIATLQTRVNDYIKYMEELEFRKAMGELRAIWVEGNNYISTTEPWTVIKTDEERARVILRACANLIRIFALLSAPVMPTVAQNILDKFGLSMTGIKNFDVKAEMNYFKGGEKFEVGNMLFERIAPEKIEELKAKYGSAK